MTINTITYQKIFPTGMAYLNHKIGVEVQLDKYDLPEDAFKLAKETVEQWNKESNPSMGLAMEYFKTDQPPGEVNVKKEKLSIQLENAASIEELMKIQNECLQHGLVNEFLTKKKSLQ